MGKSKYRQDSSDSEADVPLSRKELYRRFKDLERQMMRRLSRPRSRSRCDKAKRSSHRSRSRLSKQRETAISVENDARSQCFTPTGTPIEACSIYEESVPVDVNTRCTSVNSSQKRDPPPRSGTSGSIVDAGNIYEDTPDDLLLIHNDVVLPDDMLDLLGENPEAIKAKHFTLHEALASRWRHTIINGLKKDNCSDLLNKYEVPVNLKELLAPKLNPEILAILSKPNGARDASNAEVQNQLGKGLVALGKAISTVLKDNSLTKENKEVLLENLGDSGRILTNLFHRVSVTRRNLITPLLNKNIKELIDKSLPGDLLFGGDLGEKVKLAKNLETASKDLKLPASSSSSFRVQNRGGGGGGSIRKATSLQNVQNLNFQRPVRRVRETRQTRAQTSGDARRRYHKDDRRRRI